MTGGNGVNDEMLCGGGEQGKKKRVGVFKCSKGGSMTRLFYVDRRSQQQ